MSIKIFEKNLLDPTLKLRIDKFRWKDFNDIVLSMMSSDIFSYLHTFFWKFLSLFSTGILEFLDKPGDISYSQNKNFCVCDPKNLHTVGKSGRVRLVLNNIITRQHYRTFSGNTFVLTLLPDTITGYCPVIFS